MQMREKQQGMTFIGWLIVLALIGFTTLIVLRLAPVYMEYSTIVGALKSLKEEPLVTQKSVPEIRHLLQRRFLINDVKRISASDLEVKKASGKLTVRVQYEVRTPMIGNLDTVAKFDKTVEVIAN